MQPLRRSALVVAASLLAAGFVAACDNRATSISEPEKSDLWAEGAVANMRATISIRAPGGTIRSFTDSSIVSMQDHRGGTRIIAKGGPRPLDPSSAVISQDDGSLALHRMEGRFGGRTLKDSLGNKLTVAFFGGSAPQGAPPELTVFYRNGKPMHAMRSTYRQVNGKWVVAESRSTVFDTITGEARGEIAIRGGGNGRANGPGLEIPNLRSSGERRGAAVVDTPTTQQTCASVGWCDFLFWSAATAVAAAQTAFSVFEALYWVCANTGSETACQAADKAYKTAVTAANAAEKALAFYRSQCDKVPLQSIGIVDAASGAEVTSLIERKTPAHWEEGCEDDGTGTSGGDSDNDGTGGLECYETWGKIEISYDGGMTWSTLYEGLITVCEEAMT